MATSSSRIVTIMADSRGLDTYYYNKNYTVFYGVDSTFAYLMSQRGPDSSDNTADEGPRAYLIPDHFRAGTVESNILRVALTNPNDVILCDGIWETLLNRQKFFDEAAAKNRLNRSMYGSEDTSTIAECGTILTQMFLDGDLSISPQNYAARLDTIVGYFRRRRRHVYWLSLIVPSGRYSASTYHTGDYRPLVGWSDCLAAVNATVKEVMDRWGGHYVDLDPLVAMAGGETRALIDLWHFSPQMHKLVADEMLRRVNDRPPSETLRPSKDALGRGSLFSEPDRSLPLYTNSDETTARLASSGIIVRRVSDHVMSTLRDSIVVIWSESYGADHAARDMLSRCHGSCVVLFDKEVEDLFLARQRRH